MGDVLIWSRKHGYSGNSCIFWRAGGWGYTDDIDDAGLFTRKEAEGILSNAPRGELVLLDPEKVRAVARLHIRDTDAFRLEAEEVESHD